MRNDLLYAQKSQESASYELNLYPEIEEPISSGFVEVSDLHRVYYEESGNRSGKPVIVCHGGPGSGTSPIMRRFFDPDAYRIVMFDQRGCGKSVPFAELTDNTTWHLISDMELIRNLLGIETWQVFGGSWGSTLALAYAQQHRDRVSELILRGVFTLRPEELHWLYQEGASWIFPDVWENFVGEIPVDERDNLLNAYYRRLTDEDPELVKQSARAWSLWEGSILSLRPSKESVSRFGEQSYATAFARLEAHYFVNCGFFSKKTHVLNNLGKLEGIPATIVQGRYDVITPMRSAWELHKKWPGSELIIVPDAGHTGTEPGIISALVEATNKYRFI